MDHYNALYERDKHRLLINIEGIDSNHAQAQAHDIARALESTSFVLNYGPSIKANKVLSELFKKLAFSLFTHKECAEWTQSYSNKNPCLYGLGRRMYIRSLSLRYLDIDKSDVVTKMNCKNPKCINPYHFEYVNGKNSKLTGGDQKMLLAFLRDGVGVADIAKALNVHRSTVYRKLSYERLCSRTSD